MNILMLLYDFEMRFWIWFKSVGGHMVYACIFQALKVKWFKFTSLMYYYNMLCFSNLIWKQSNHLMIQMSLWITWLLNLDYNEVFWFWMCYWTINVIEILWLIIWWKWYLFCVLPPYISCWMCWDDICTFEMILVVIAQ